ncbi:MAG: hypothetical protein IJ269_01450 [Bacteroidales bacterium]|nr:hypothetical protein [Bacteroidales bacterium]MBR7167870.1 hypothetical protein [Bacteroidales bacterium]
MKAKKTPKTLKLKLTLSEKDNILLLHYAKEHGVSRAVAAKQIIHQSLIANIKAVADSTPENQLRLFDNVQINLFDIIKEESGNQDL